MKAFYKLTLSQTNCFLLHAADGFLLIDCGGAGDDRRFLAELVRLGVKAQAIRYLLLTHHHSDHCGLLPLLLRENPDLRVIMSESCAAYMKTGSHFKPDQEQYATKPLGLAISMYQTLSKKITDAFTPYYSRPHDILCESQDMGLDFIGVSGRLLHTPGHTKDSISLVVGENAFVGDAARNMLQFCGAPHAPVLYYDYKLCLESWAKLIRAGAKTICPAHGAPFPAKRFCIYCKNRGMRSNRI